MKNVEVGNDHQSTKNMNEVSVQSSDHNKPAYHSFNKIKYEESDEMKNQRLFDSLMAIVSPIIVDGINTGYSVSVNGDVFNPDGKKLSPDFSNKGYARVTIRLGNGDKVRRSVHRLVAEAFLTNDDPEHKTVVNHKNSNPMDNWRGNLEWCTQKHNVHHELIYGKMITGGENGISSKYSNNQIHEVCRLLCEGLNMYDIQAKTGVPRDTIKNVYNHKGWTFISDQYPLDVRRNKYHEKFLTEPTVRKICEMIDNGISDRDISTMLGIKFRTVYEIHLGMHWKKISSEYNFIKKKESVSHGKGEI